MKRARVFAASLVVAFALAGAVTAAKAEVLFDMRPAVQQFDSSGTFAYSQPLKSCFWGCSFHYFAQGDRIDTQYLLTSPLDGKQYYVTTVDDQVGYVPAPLLIHGFGAR